MALALGRSVNAQAKGVSSRASKPSRQLRPVIRAAGAVASEVPDMNKRVTMNLILAGGIGLPVAGLAGPFALFFVPNIPGGGAGGQAAKDALGNDVTVKSWLATHQKGDRSLTQGLKGDPTYLIVKEDNSIESYGLNAVCTHLGCVVPWNAAENKFKCPCHGSQYNNEGKVIRGPAPLSLALAHAKVDETSGTVLFSPWTETDFRTGTDPWWKA